MSLMLSTWLDPGLEPKTDVKSILSQAKTFETMKALGHAIDTNPRHAAEESSAWRRQQTALAAPFYEELVRFATDRGVSGMNRTPENIIEALAVQEVFYRNRLDSLGVTNLGPTMAMFRAKEDEIRISQYLHTGALGAYDLQVKHGRPDGIKKRVEELSALEKCYFCFLPYKKLWRCGKCNTAKYCSKECQRNDWAKQHKLLCK
jgi:hypothetical protein